MSRGVGWLTEACPLLNRRRRIACVYGVDDESSRLDKETMLLPQYHNVAITLLPLWNVPRTDQKQHYVTLGNPYTERFRLVLLESRC